MGATGEPQSTAVDVQQLLDECGMSRFNVWLVAFTFFLVLFDGYDVTAMGFAAPAIIKAWHITDTAAMGRVLAASMFGMLFGGPLFGYIGDRYGRKVAIVSATLSFGVLSWATTFATSMGQLAGLRFLAGLGIAGVMPNVVALMGEFAPRRFRATMIIVMFTGVAFGGGFPGPVAAVLVPKYGWQVLFTIGGAIPVLVGLIALAWLPESIKFLALQPERKPAALKLLARLRPDRTFAPQSELVIRDEGRQAAISASPRQLFSDGRGGITSLLWVLFISNLMGYMFLLNWTPVLLSSINLPVSKAAVANALFQVGGAVGGWVLARPMDKYGLTPMKIIAAVSVPIVALLGVVGSISAPLLFVFEFFAGFCILSLQFGMIAISAMIYPTSFRSVGAGWAQAVGRVGSVVGPVVGGILIAQHFGVSRLYMLAAIPFLIATIACVVLQRLLRTRFQGSGLTQTARTGRELPGIS